MHLSQTEDYLLDLKAAEALRLRNTESDLKQARVLCTSLINRFPDYFGALLTLGLTELALRNHQVALGVLFRAVILNPQSWRANLALGSVLLELKATETADHYIKLANKSQPDEGAALFSMADLCLRKGEYDEAVAYAERAITKDGASDEPKLLMIKALVLSGNYDAAFQILDRFAANGARLVNFVSEAMTLPERQSKELFKKVSLIEVESLKPASSSDETTIQYARAHKLHYEERYDEAFSCLTDINKKLFNSMSKEHHTQVRKQSEIISYLRDRRYLVASPITKAKSRLLLVLGASRSGKSTLEGFLGETAAFKIGYESTVIENCVKQTLNNAGLRQSNLLEVVPTSLTPEFLKILDSEIGRHVNPETAYTITNPSRIFDAFRLLQSRDNTWAVFVRRNKLDNAIRIFMKRYQYANSYSYDISATIRHIDWYNEMIEILHTRFGGRTCIIEYEDLIADPGRECKKIFDMMGVNARIKLRGELQGDVGFGRPYKEIISKLSP